MYQIELTYIELSLKILNSIQISAPRTLGPGLMADLLVAVAVAVAVPDLMADDFLRQKKNLNGKK